MSGDIYVQPPKMVTTAISAIWLSLFISIGNDISRLLMTEQDISGEMFIFPAISTIISVMIISFLTDKLGSGRNWSRILLSIVFVLSLLGSIDKFLGTEFNWVNGGFIIAGIATYGYAIALLFFSSGREWFRQNRQSTTETQ